MVNVGKYTSPVDPVGLKAPPGGLSRIHDFSCSFFRRFQPATTH